MNSFRSDLPALSNKYYFNYGGQGPLPKSSLDAITNSWLKIQSLGPFTNNVWPYIAEEIIQTKNKISKSCGVNIKRVCLTENVTSGCILPLWGITFSEGDRILISDCEHPGVVSALKELARRFNLHIDIVNVQLIREGTEKQSITNNLVIQNIEKGLKPTTKLVALSHVLWNTGAIMPIELVSEILSNHKNKPFLLVDAAQSFGHIPIKEAASKSDIYAFTGHKWSFGPEGLGGVILSERILQESKPTVIGWKSITNEENIHAHNQNPFHSDGRRFEVATSCTPLLAGLRCSMNLIEGVGDEIERIKKIKFLSHSLWEKLCTINNVSPILKGAPPSGIISFTVDPKIKPKEVVKLLGKESIWIRVIEDPTWLRACVHITSTEEEILKLTSTLTNIIS